jgi:hypothetical protein
MMLYPSTRTAAHDYKIPAEKALCIKNGTPVQCENRDIRFPVVWEVTRHPLCHSSFVKTIWVILMDTSDEARQSMSIFESSLTTPLGPDAFMKDFGKQFPASYQTLLTARRSGLMQVKPGTVVYGRSIDGLLDEEGYRTPDDDYFLCCIGDG